MLAAGASLERPVGRNAAGSVSYTHLAAQAGSLEGAPGGPVAACLAAAAQARGNLVSGPLGRDVRITCTVEGTGPQVIVVTADGTLPNWVVPITAHVHVMAQANIEVDPTQPS